MSHSIERITVGTVVDILYCSVFTTKQNSVLVVTVATQNVSKMSTEDFYLRYYVGHKGKFGHEFLEFEFRPDGKLRYANNSNYKNDTMIRKEAYVHNSVMEELKRVILDSEIMAEDDSLWPPPDRVGRQVSSIFEVRFQFV